MSPVAAAECPIAKPFITPPDGTRLPPRASVYVMVPPQYLQDSIHVHSPKGIETTFQTWFVDGRGEFDLVRVDLGAEDDATVHLAGERRSLSARYEIEDRAIDEQLAITGVTRSGDRLIDIITTGNAIALRFAWDDGTTTLVPIEYRERQRSVSDYDQRAQLGELPCIGWNVDPTLFATNRAFVLYALFPSGNERRVGVSRVQIGDEGVVMPTDLYGKRAGDERPLTCGHAARDTREAACSRETHWPAATGALGGLVVLVGGALLRRRRRSRSHVPRHA